MLQALTFDFLSVLFLGLNLKVRKSAGTDKSISRAQVCTTRSSALASANNFLQDKKPSLWKLPTASS